MASSRSAKAVLSKTDFYERLFEDEEWIGLAGRSKNSDEVQSFLRRFYRKMCDQFEVNYDLKDIKRRLIITEKQRCSYHNWRLGHSSLYFDVDSGCLDFPIIISPFFRGSCEAFALILVDTGKTTYTYSELASLYNSKKESIRQQLETRKEKVAALDIIAKLVSLDFLIYHDRARPETKFKGQQTRPKVTRGKSTSPDARRCDESMNELNEDSVRHTRSRKLVTDQHYGRRRSQRDTEEPKADNDIKLNRIKKLTQNSVGVRFGVEISSDKQENDGQREMINFGCQQVQGKSTATVHVRFCDTSMDGKILKFRCILLGSSGQFEILDDVDKKEIAVESQNSYSFVVEYSSSSIGAHNNMLAFSCAISDAESFVITLNLAGKTEESSDMEIIKSTGPYVLPKPVFTVEEPGVDIIKGIPPEMFGNIEVKRRLANYPIPKDLRFNVNNGKGKVTDDWLELMQEPLTKSNYTRKFQALLHLEELQMEVDIKRYEMKKATFQSKNSLLTLVVPGLAEGRPSLIVGDRIIVGETNTDGVVSKTKYEGFIHHVEDEQIHVKFASRFHSGVYIKGGRYNVQFVFNRFTLKMMHRALEITNYLISGNIFPAANLTLGETYTPILTDAQISQMRVKDRKLESNPEQLQAVKNIVQGTSRPHPYVIFGPPGTGKTMTMVEAMRQVLLMIPGSRILACAPSNGAADLLLYRLLNPCVISKSELFRINALSRALLTVPENFDIMGNCKVENRKFVIPNIDELLTYRVIVSTNTTAGRLVSMGVPVGHFTHVFMDESGQAMEPESLIALAGLFTPECKNGGQIVLAGDPKQLSPILRSPLACQYGLQMPLLERLMNYPAYQRRPVDDGSSDSDSGSSSSDDFEDFEDVIEKLEKEPENIGKFDQRFITKLIHNYRSHPDIIEIPNELFYDNELIASADDFARTSLCQWNTLPAKDCPIIFHGVQGNDQREKNSPSFFNPEEVTGVVGYVRQLLDESRLGIKPEHIGIISPYRKQVEKIRKLLSAEKRRTGIKNIKVGSVEEFQGQEKRIIIISTVRSNKDFLQLDAKFRLGFLRNPKRFNVAVTRAQALLILVGNPFVLGADPCWNRLLEFCLEKNCYTGCKYRNETEAVQSIIDQFAKMGIDVNTTEFNEEVPWVRKDA